MTDERELVATANGNFVASFRKLAEHCAAGGHRQLGGVFAYVTGLPISLFNGCVVFDHADPRDLDAALGWVAEHRVPMRLFVVSELEAELHSVPATHGLARTPTPYPGMVLHPIPPPPEPAPGVDVVPVGERGPDEFLGVAVAMGLTRDLAETMFSASFLWDPDVEAFVGRLDGRAVGYSLSIRSAGAGGVYNVGTLPEARRRGVGTALTWAAADASRRAGLDCAVLQSSEMAVSMYEAMGFRTVVAYADFSEPARLTGQETPVPPKPQ